MLDISNTPQSWPWVLKLTGWLRKLIKNGLAIWAKWRWRWVHGDKPFHLSSIEIPQAGIEPVIWVNPRKLGFKCNLDTKREYGGPLFVSGDWDQARITMDFQEESDPRYQSCRELLSGVPVRECSEFKTLIARVHEGQKPRGFSTEAQVEQYLYDQLNMYRLVQSEGVLRTQEELGKARYGGEINCVVGRDGLLLKTSDGNHRLAVARVLEISRIPVQVSRIHADLLPYVQGFSARSATECVNNFLHELQEKYL